MYKVWVTLLFVDLSTSNLIFYYQIQMEMVRPKNLFAVICHGDLWLSNILFKYGSNDQKEIRPVEVKFIDFQSARFASLATDLVLFLFTSVRVKFLHIYSQWKMNFMLQN